MFVGELAHEIGHYMNQAADTAFTNRYEVSPNSPDAYSIDAMIGLHREGEAVYNNYVVQQEIFAKIGGKIYLAGALNVDGSSTGLQQMLDSQRSFDQTNGYTTGEDRNLLIEQAMAIYAKLPGSANGLPYYNYYGQVNGAKAPAQAPQLVNVFFTDPDATGNITTEKTTFTSGNFETQNFNNGVIVSSTLDDQFGKIISQTTYTHNADGSYSAEFTDGAGHETAVQNIASNGSYSVTQFSTSTGYETSQTNYNAAGTPLYKDDYNASSQLVTEEGYNAAGQEVTQKIIVPGTTHVSSTIFFDPTTGNETSEQHYGDSGLTTYQDDYNTSGQLISEEGYNSAGQKIDQLLVTPGTLHVYEKLLFDPSTGLETTQQNFNTSGQMTSQDNFNMSNQLVSQDDYNAAGQETDRLLVTPGTTNIYQKLIFDPTTGHETSAQNFDVSGHLTYQDDYNASGQLITEESYNAAGQETTKKFLTPGTTHAETTYFFDTSNGSVNYVANYDASGNETLGTEYNSSGLRTVSHTFDTATGNESERNIYATPGSNTPTTSIYFSTTTRHETFQNDYDANGNQLSQENYDPEDGNLLSREILGGSVVTQQLLYTPGWQYASESINFLSNGSQSTHYYFNQSGQETRESIFNGSPTEVERLMYDTQTSKLVGDYKFYANGVLQNQTLFNSSGQELEYDEFNTAAQQIDRYDFNPGAQYAYNKYSFTAGTSYASFLTNFDQTSGHVTSETQFDPNTGKALSSSVDWNQFDQILNGGGSGSNVTSFIGGGGFPSGSGYIAFEGGSGSIFGGFGFSGSSEAALRSDVVANTLLDHLDLHDTRNGQAAFGQALDDARSAANATPGNDNGRPNVEGQWGKSELTWSLSNLDSTGHAFSSSTMAEYEQAVTQAFSAWSAQTGFVFKEVAAGSSADIQIDWNALDTASTGVVGFTSGHTTGTTITDAHIRLEDPTQTSLDGTLTYTGTQATLSQTALHEIGHALGLGDTTDARSVMYYALSDPNRTLDATDTLGAQAVGANHRTQAAGMAALMIQSMASFGAAPSASMPLYDPVRTAVHPMLAMPAH
ncbi:hypothetical protein WK27_26775 [Burkholderia vietnamiensis]|nr:hypothetical protein WK27_26775 [Burkholderia vietnamiensis]